MQRTTELYRKSMKESLRGESFMVITFGLINQEVQAHATVGDAKLSYLSSPKTSIVTNDLASSYATLEDEYTQVDGGMLFPPKPNSGDIIKSQGLILEDIVTSAGTSIVLNFNTVPIEVKGLTLNFGEIYATDFDIEGENGQVIHVVGNDKSEYVTQDVIEATRTLKLTFYKMKNKANRVRLNSILFGFGLVYTNDDIVDSELESYVSPICEDIPQYDFSVKLNNYDRYFDVDNPKSAINYIETGQKIGIMYGYRPEKNEDIEWLAGQTLYCSSWSSDDSHATIECQDIFRNMDGEYYKGKYRDAGYTYFDAAEAIFKEAGIEDYAIDPYLKKMQIQNPIPRVSYKESLQMIANACRCVLTQKRSGIPNIQTSFVPDYYLETDGKETEYSNIQSAMIGLNMKEFASFATNYMTVDGGMYFPPKVWVKDNTGYVSSQQSDEKGQFAEAPFVTVKLEAAYEFVGFNMVFGSSLPSSMTVTTFLNGEKQEEFTITNGIEKYYQNHYEFLKFDQLKVKFNSTVDPNNRIVLHRFSFGDITSFSMTRDDILNSPTALKLERVKDVNVAYYVYRKNTVETSIANEERSVSNGEEATYFFDEPCSSYRAEFNKSNSAIEILDFADYYVKVRFKTSGKGTVSIYGNKYNVVEQFVHKSVNSIGKTITWRNPLVGNKNDALELAEWLGKYYSVDVEYEYDTRGNPEIDANDIIYQENPYDPESQVNIYRTALKFSHGISGHIQAKKVERWEGNG